MDQKIFYSVKSNSNPDYQRIYLDILDRKFPEKKESCKSFFEKEELSFLDIKKINELIFNPGRKYEAGKRKFNAYDKASIFKILDYQNTHKLNNSQLAKHFGISRNTISKWKKLFY